MRAPAVSFAERFVAALMAALLAVTLVPASALAEGESDTADASVEEPQEASAPQSDEGSGSTPAASTGEGGTLASVLVGTPTTFINSDVALDGEPVIGSFTVDGLTFAVTGGSNVELVGVSPDRQQVIGSQEGDGAPVAPMLASGPDGSDAGGSTLALPGTITYEGIDYAVISIGAYAFYLSGVTTVELPASVGNVDDRAFRSSDVSSVAVADGNPSYSSFDGALYAADQLSLLLIPEGKQGTVLLPKTAEVAPPSVFSHCSLVQAIAVEEGSAAFASENGLLYSSDLTTLLRVPAGATDITIHDGCTTIAAGALEACASLATITAPASVISISPDVFTSVPTISLPAAAIAEDAPQLTAMVALSSADEAANLIDASMIAVSLSSESDVSPWKARGFAVGEKAGEPDGDDLCATTQSASTYAAVSLRNIRFNTDNERGLYHAGVALGNPTYRSMKLKDAGLNYTVGTLSWDSTYGYIANYLRSGAPDPWYWFSDDDQIARRLCLGEPTASSAVYQDGALPASVTQAVYLLFDYLVMLDDVGGSGGDGSFKAFSKTDTPCPDSLACPSRENAVFNGYYQLVNGEKRFWYKGISNSSGEKRVMQYDGGANIPERLTSDVVLYADWLPAEYDVSFDTSSEPGDEDAPGVEKPDETIDVDDGPTVIEDPQRPGYVFQGWTIPNADGTQGIDQDLVYQDETDGKWYVDASKLPDYANDEGRVELTARWTAALKVDAPLSATFYYDLTQPDGEGYFDEQRDAAVEGATGATGTAAIRNHSAVPLRVAGMEAATSTSSARLLKKDGQWLNDLAKGEVGVLTVFPTTNEATGTADAALGPSSASQAAGDDLAHAVTLALDEVKLEAAFDAGAWAIEAATVGDNGVVSATGDMRLGYRLDLGGAGGVTLDYDALLAATGGDEGTAADLTSLSYCFALEGPRPTGTKSDALYVEVTDPEVGSVGVYGLADIKAAADDLASRVDPATDPNDWGSISSQIAGSPYAKLYTELLEGGACFKLKVDSAYHDVQLLGICQDTRSDNGRRAGLTFGSVQVHAASRIDSVTHTGGWDSSSNLVKSYLDVVYWNGVDSAARSEIVEVRKFQQMAGAEGSSSLQGPTYAKAFVPSVYEVYGRVMDSFNGSEGLTVANKGYAPFQYRYYQIKGVGSGYNVAAAKTGASSSWWLRSSSRFNADVFCFVTSAGNCGTNISTGSGGIVPCFAL